MMYAGKLGAAMRELADISQLIFTIVPFLLVGVFVLLKIRSKSAHDAGRWEIPGGKVKKCEYFDNALKREYLEETGLEIIIESMNNLDAT